MGQNSPSSSLAPPGKRPAELWPCKSRGTPTFCLSGSPATSACSGGGREGGRAGSKSGNSGQEEPAGGCQASQTPETQHQQLQGAACFPLPAAAKKWGQPGEGIMGSRQGTRDAFGHSPRRGKGAQPRGKGCRATFILSLLLPASSGPSQGCFWIFSAGSTEAGEKEFFFNLNFFLF